MKKIIVLIISGALLLSSGIAIGSSINGDYKGNPIVKVSLQGKEIPAQDVPAQIVDGRTLVPLYYLQSMGYDLSWDQTTYTVTVKQKRDKLSENKSARENLLNAVKGSVGIIYTYDKNNRPLKQGTGFIINGDGLMVTNHHVMQDSDHAVFTVQNKSYTFYKGDFDNGDADIFGVVLSKLPGHNNEAFTYLHYTTEHPTSGTKVLAFGYPKQTFSMSDGIVDSGVGYTIVHTATTESGSSGSPLIDDYGDVVGIVKADKMAIPMDNVQININSLK